MYKKAPLGSFFVFHVVQLWVLPNEYPVLCQHRPGLNEKNFTLVILMNWAYVSLKWEDILKADNNRRRQQQQNRIVTYALLASSISLLVTLLFLSLCQNWSWVLVQLKVRSYKRSTMYVLQDYQFKLAYDLLSRVEFRVVPLYTCYVGRGISR